MDVKFLRGLAAAYAAIETKDDKTFYYVTDEAKLYLGSLLLSNEVTATAFSALQTQVETNKGDIADIKFQLENMASDETVSNIQTALTTLTGRVDTIEGDYLKKADKEALQAEIDAVEAVATAAETKTDAAQKLADAKAYTDEEITGLEFSLSEDGKTLELKNKAGASVATLDTSDFVVDGMLSSVVADQENNKLTFTWNTDSGIQVTEIELDSIADIYTGSEGTEVKVAVSNENVISATLTDAVKASLAKADTALQAADLADYAKTADVTSAIETAVSDKATKTELSDGLAGKVDKVEGYSLVSDTEIARLAEVKNYDDTEVRSLISTNEAAAKAADDKAAAAQSDVDALELVVNDETTGLAAAHAAIKANAETCNNNFTAVSNQLTWGSF